MKRKMLLITIVVAALIMLFQVALARSINYRDWLPTIEPDMLVTEEVVNASLEQEYVYAYPAPVDPTPTQKKKNPKPTATAGGYPAPVDPTKEPTIAPMPTSDSAVWYILITGPLTSIRVKESEIKILDQKERSGQTWYYVEYDGGQFIGFKE